MVIVMNRLKVPPQGRAPLERAFLERESHLDKVRGFIRFRFLRQRDGDQYIVYTEWESREAFESWRDSKHFRRAHRDGEGDDERPQQPGPQPQSQLEIYEVLDVIEAPD